MAIHHLTNVQRSLLASARECGLSTNVLSGFELKLWECLWKADSNNLARLGRGYPEHAHAIQHWRHDEEYPSALRSLATAGNRDEAMECFARCPALRGPTE